MAKSQKRTIKPTVTLNDEGGKPRSFIDACREAARKAGWPQERWRTILKEMQDCDYIPLLKVGMKYFDVENGTLNPRTIAGRGLVLLTKHEHKAL